jgi:hypothetical protein
MPRSGGCSKKHALNPWRKEQWCLSEASAEFVARMEGLLALYEEPDDPKRPRVCFDKRPCPWLADRREPLAMAAGHPIRDDHEYTRHGPATPCFDASFRRVCTMFVKLGLDDYLPAAGI